MRKSYDFSMDVDSLEYDKKMKLQKVAPGGLRYIKCGNTAWGRPRPLNSTSQQGGLHNNI